MSEHQPVIAKKTAEGVWGVFCDTCSHEAGDYTYPCQKGAQGFWRDTPPEELIER